MKGPPDRRMQLQNGEHRVRERSFRSVALPSISTGAFGYPVASASAVVASEIAEAVRRDSSLAVTVVCFDVEVLRAYQSALP